MSINTSQEKYIVYLEKCRQKYLETLEDIFGPRDSRFEFGKLGHSHDGPRTYFPYLFHYEGNCRIDIYVSTYPWNNYCRDQGAWQIAHECVHLLDPCKCETVNVLEEGLATWFQNNPEYHSEEVQIYADKQNYSEAEQNYSEAERLVRKYGKPLRDAVKTLRFEGLRISEIDAISLCRAAPTLTTEDGNRLCSLFH